MKEAYGELPPLDPSRRYNLCVMNAEHPLIEPLFYPQPDGSYEFLTLAEAVDRGLPVVRACLLEQAKLGDFMCVPTLLYLATGRDEHAVNASAPLVDELCEAGVTVPVEWFEQLEALKDEMTDEERALDAEPDDIASAFPVRIERMERNSRAAWASEGLVADRAAIEATIAEIRALPTAPARSTGRSQRSSSRRTRSTSSRDGPARPSDDDPHLARIIALVRLLLGSGR